VTTILGAYIGHDSNYAVVRDGRILRHIEAERVTRVKHQRGYNESTLQQTLKAAGVTLDDVDIIAIGGGAYECLDASISDLASQLLRISGLAAFKLQALDTTGNYDPARRLDSLEGRYLAYEARIGARTVPVYVVHHHVAHAAGAYYQSPFLDADVMSWDGGGDLTNLLWFHARDGKIDKLLFDPPSGTHARSIGGGWSWIGLLYRIGDDHEGKVMGHAAYGAARDDLKELVRDFIDHGSSPPGWFVRGEKLTKALNASVDFSSTHSETLKALSASLQAATEEVMLRVLEATGIAPGANLVLTGGCAYNCVANTLLAHRHPNTYVTSCPHDGGLGLGAALFVWHHVLGNAFCGLPEATPYLGYGNWTAPISIAEQVVSDLLAGKIVAWVDGPAESGKRALGARSLLFDPRRADAKDYLNERVKRREWFRPFAPSVLADHTEWADGTVPPSWYMSFSQKIADSWLSKVPAVAHVDGTCRPQTVTSKNNPVYRRILELFYEATGVPMVLNTSYNVQEPIINDEEQALATFNRTPIDVLYLNGARHTK
jgi:carbamoyltransferase